MLRAPLLAASLALAAGPALAEPTPLTAPEIEALLAGNTIEGTWNDSDYKQYYATDGTTLYVPAGGEPDEGKWRVDADLDRYESWWEETGWTPYDVAREGDTYYWIDGDDRHPFTVTAGNQLD